MRIFLIILCAVLTFIISVSCEQPEPEIPLTSDEHMELGENYLRRLNYDMAIEHFMAATATDPRNPRGYINAAETLLVVEQTEDAVSVLTRGVEILPNEPQITQMLFDILTEDGMFDEAGSVIRQGLTILPGRYDYQTRLRMLKELTHVHSWLSADCQRPKRCAECGLTEGRTVPHVWKDANLQQPQICIDCEITRGSTLTADFEKTDYVINMKQGEAYPYMTLSGGTNPVDVTGEAVFESYRVFSSSGEEYPYKPGYEYQAAAVSFTFDDDNARKNGVGYAWFAADYYIFDEDKIIDNYDMLPESDIPGFRTGGIVNYCGVDYEYYVSVSNKRVEWVDNVLYIEAECVYLAPAGYDGFIRCIYSIANNTEGETAGSKLDENSLIFRLKEETG